MIFTNNIINVFVFFLIFIFYSFTIFQKAKLIYLFRSLRYHFANIFFPYNVDDLSISKIGYVNYFNGFFFMLINWIVVWYSISLISNGDSNEIELNLQKNIIYINIITFIILISRFLIIKIILNLFIDSKLKLIFYKNFIINIIISLFLVLNFLIYVYNDFYDFNLLKVSSIVLVFFYLFFQAKNYLSYIVKLEVKEVMYFILYLCSFKVAPWIWFYSFIF